MADLRETLTHYDLKVLQAMARELNVKLDAKSPKDAARLLERYLGAAETVRRAVDRLREPEREALRRLQRMGGSASARGLKLHLLQAGLVAKTPKANVAAWRGPTWTEDYEAKQDYSGKPCFEDVMARLAVMGLVFSEREASRKNIPVGFSPAPLIFIPEVVFRQLPQPPAAGSLPSVEPEQVLAGSARQFQRDLGRYWRLVRRSGELRLTTQGYLYKTDAKSIQAALGRQDSRGEQDNPRLRFLRAQLTDLKLLVAGPQGLTPSDQAGFLTRPAHERVKASFEAWRDGQSWNELLRIPIKHGGYDHRNPAPPELLRARQVVLKHIAAMGTGWVSSSALLDHLAVGDYDFLFPRSRVNYAMSPYYYSPYQQTPYYASNNPYNLTFEDVGNEADGWIKVEGGFIGALVAGPLFWMGLIDLGDADRRAPTTPREESVPEAYRLTDLGAWVLGLGPAPEIAEEGGRVVVQPNFQIMAMEPISDRLLGELDEFADSEGGDRALLYRLTRQSVYRGQQNGWDVPRIIARLQELCGAELPGNIRRSLEEWDALHNRIVIRRNATLVLASGASVLDDVYSDAHRAEALGRRIAGEISLPPGKVDDVAQMLRQAGWPPLITPRGQDDSAGSVRLDEAGNVTFLQPTPSLGARARLASLVDGNVGGRQHIKPQTVKAALKAGRDVNAILADLRAVSVGQVPPALVTQIKAWSKYYGDGAMSQVTLLQVRDMGVLNELCADPELAPFIKPFEAGQRAMAIVDPQYVDQVRKLLAQRGIDLETDLTDL
jgi:Helicase conserved C-terminal domain